MSKLHATGGRTSGFPLCLWNNGDRFNLMEFVATKKSGNIMISKTINSYLRNFVTPKETWFCIVKDILKAIMFLHSMNYLHNDVRAMF